MSVSELRKVNLADETRVPCRSYAATKMVCRCPTPRVIVSGVTCNSVAVCADRGENGNAVPMAIEVTRREKSAR
jgi:hypothetical protein